MLFRHCLLVLLFKKPQQSIQQPYLSQNKLSRLLWLPILLPFRAVTLLVCCLAFLLLFQAVTLLTHLLVSLLLFQAVTLLVHLLVSLLPFQAVISIMAVFTHHMVLILLIQPIKLGFTIPGIFRHQCSRGLTTRTSMYMRPPSNQVPPANPYYDYYHPPPQNYGPYPSMVPNTFLGPYLPAGPGYTPAIISSQDQTTGGKEEQKLPED